MKLESRFRFASRFASRVDAWVEEGVDTLFSE